ncbi:MAG: endonuclease/exonuclease/phosphatase (EEP) superfamily protein YafD [Verrucomicrobiales bacterium]
MTLSLSSTNSAKKQWLYHSRQLAIRAAPWILFLALFIRLTVRDSWFITAPIFYAFALPLQATGWAILSGIMLKGKRVGFAIAYISLALTIGIYWFQSSYRIRDLPTSAESDLTVLFWNTAYADHPNPTLIDLVNEHQPDIVAMVEAGGLTRQNVVTYESELPRYRVVRKLGMAMGCFIRGDFAITDQQRLPNRSGFARIKVPLSSGAVDLLIVDIGPNAFYPRGNRIARILQEATGTGRTTIVAGDFNTPWDSAFFDPWRRQLIHADDHAGTRFRETWRSGLPILAIDHVWVTPDLRPLSTQKIYAPGTSDHACLIVKIARK